jgi:hypothetical protein
MKKGIVTIGFSSHRAEALPFIRREMERHQIIVLEEPSSPYFSAMLKGGLSIHEYLMEIDSGFPEFERLMCGLLRELHKKGHKIVQVEPYLEVLLKIHDLFAEGKTPEDIVKLSRLVEVYQAEKHATRALITYYTRSMATQFNQVIQSVKDFARADAKRLTLRACLRAKAILSMIRSDKDIYIESGYIHYPLYLCLRQKLPPYQKIRVVFLLQPVVKRLEGRRRNMGPGDILTLNYAFNSGIEEDLSNLLAARSLIYIKLIQKEEMLPGISDAPHSEDEVEINRLVDRLGFEDCRLIFEKIRFEDRERALHLVKTYVKKKGNAISYGE